MLNIDNPVRSQNYPQRRGDREKSKCKVKSCFSAPSAPPRLHPVFYEFKRLTLVLFASLLLVLLSVGSARAITVTASPNPAKTDQTVTVSITATFIGTVSCPIEANFGDSGLWGTVGTCGGGTCNYTVNHAYLTAGTFTISARSQGCLPGPTAPDPATTVITVNPTQTLSATVMPSSFTVSRDTAGIQNITYALNATVDVNLQSASGTFLAGGAVLGTAPVPLTAVVRGGRGTISETVTIPAAVIQKALALQATKISYVRTFTDGAVLSGAASITTAAEIIISTAAGADFGIKRLRLYFDNGRPEITVNKGRPPKIHAELSFAGSGLLQGFWEVDGRMLAPVNEHLSYGGSVVLDSPAVSPLPTFDPGGHRVRFVVTDPPLNTSPPEAIYYVADDGAESRNTGIKPIWPGDNAVLEYVPTAFRWIDAGRSAVYLLEVFEEGDKRRVFSAQVKAPEYRLPEFVLKQLFVPGGRYLWKVTGSDHSGNSTGESPLRSFSFE